MIRRLDILHRCRFCDRELRLTMGEPHPQCAHVQKCVERMIEQGARKLPDGVRQ